jgi:hypothetical protein
MRESFINFSIEQAKGQSLSWTALLMEKFNYE